MMIHNLQNKIRKEIIKKIRTKTLYAIKKLKKGKTYYMSKRA